MRPRCGTCAGKELSRSGHFIRKSDGTRVQRWRCSQCGHSRSSAQFSPCYRQNKRHLNPIILKLLCSAVSQRRIALILGISRLTVARKFRFLAMQAALKNQKARAAYKKCPATRVYVDEMEDRIHTKCKPAAIALLVTEDRKILAHSTSRILPKNRKLLKITKKKYPEWIPNSRERFDDLIRVSSPLVAPEARISSDQKIYYAPSIKRYLPQAEHRQFASRRAVVAGQGELKQGGRDPLFALNHTCAMLRANINRLVRRTWCTSKRLDALHAHIEIYTHFHNSILT